MTTPMDQQRQFQERIERLNANRASTQQLKAAADPLSGMRGKRSNAGGVPNSTARFTLIMVVLLVLGGVGGWVAADYDRISNIKQERVRVVPEVVFLTQLN
jgi:hypothetical protein